MIDNMGIPFDPKEEKPELTEEEKVDEGKEVEEEGLPKKNEASKKNRDPKEEMPLFLNQVTNLIAAAVPGEDDMSDDDDEDNGKDDGDKDDGDKDDNEEDADYNDEMMITIMMGCTLYSIIDAKQPY